MNKYIQKLELVLFLHLCGLRWGGCVQPFERKNRDGKAAEGREFPKFPEVSLGLPGKKVSHIAAYCANSM